MILYGSVLLILHSYLIYPLSLFLLARIRSLHSLPSVNKFHPEVCVLIAAHNEAKVIENKILSILKVDYPVDKLNIYIGSDNSTDETNAIVSQYADQYSLIKPFYFQTRTGKPGIINFLAEKAIESSKNINEVVLIITDADITHDKSSFEKMTRHFVDSKVHLVDTNLKNVGTLDSESNNESKYLEFEVRIKKLESLLFQRMMGPFGGCFAIKGLAYENIPGNFLVDDFYLAMCVLEKGNYVLTDIEALAYEESNTALNTEYKRKRRISAGNFQNLNRFKHLLVSKYPGLSYAFLSHKVLRWFTPFLFLLAIIAFILLCVLGNPFYIFVAKFVVLLLLLVVIIDFTILKILKFGSITSKLLYFVFMNIALFHGFIDYIKGIRSNVWQPTKRSIR